MDQCFIKTCKRPAAKMTRGLCMLCYKAAKAKVTVGEVTWDRLAELQLCKGETADTFEEAYKQAIKDDQTDCRP